MASEFKVKTNCFEIVELPTKEYHQYSGKPFQIVYVPFLIIPSVEFSPKPKTFCKRQEVIQHLQNSVAPTTFRPKALYDGDAIIYSSHRLKLRDSKGGSILVSLSDVQGSAPLVEGGKDVIMVTLKRTFSPTIRPGDIKALINTQATSKTATAANLLQLIIKQATNQNYPHNRRAFFSSAGSKPIGGGLELWRGSVRPTTNSILVNIDTSVTAMYRSGPVFDAALDFVGVREIRQLPSNERNPKFLELERFLKNRLIHVEGYFGRRTKTIRGLIPYGGRYKFQKDGRTTTVADHARVAYGLNTRFPDAFGIVLSGKFALRPSIVPAEFCSIQPGQLYKKKLPDHLARQMVGFATISPDDRYGAITGGGQQVGSLASPILGYASSEYVVESGMRISSTPLTITGKILDALRKLYDGAWNIGGQRVRNPALLTIWGIVCFIPNYREEHISHHAGQLLEAMRNIGMYPVLLMSGSGNNVHGSLNKFMEDVISKTRSAAVQLIVVLFPNKGDQIRSAVKQWGDVMHGILTSHMKEDKLPRANNQYYANVALKINARLGGSNHIVQSPTFNEISRAPFMIMGADVSHNSPGSLRPSISSLVWSYDAHATQYVAFSGVQSPRTEGLANLKDMAKAAIKQFGEKAGNAPATIIFYRDGISEGELDAVGIHEVELLQTAVDELWVERGLGNMRKPKITFLVVGKRHHMVFFGQEQRVRDRTGNLKAGFVTTSGVTSPLFKDFYLQSHAAIKGTSRSGHYIVLRDDNFNFDQQKIQDLSFALCHTYAKAMRAISIPTPVYYAHEVCTRGAFHFNENLRYGGDDASSTVSGAQNFDLATWVNSYKHVNSRIRDKMYFL
ncbi:Piwi-domain-containing protein [Hymenopellis radicata]|nr:Piwi-domain-containing protein [Hymenopellis radicata]